jgi:hypothetical protein
MENRARHEEIEMSVPMLPLPPELDVDSVVEEDRVGCEFVDGEWKEKHPPFPVRK